MRDLNGKFGAFIGCSNYPECGYTRQLTVSDANHEGIVEVTTELEFPKVLGMDPEGQGEISLRKGPYGIYLQRGDGKGARRIGLPKDISPEKVNMDYAVKLLSMPLVLGNDPNTGEIIRVGIGKFGPYLEVSGKYVSLKQYKPLEITLEQALEVLSEAANKPSGAKRNYTRKKKS